MLHRILSGVAWSLIARVFNQGGTLAVNLILANLLGRTAFGEYAIIYTTILTVTTISGLGVGSSATKYIAEFRLIDKQKAARVLRLCSATATITGSLACCLLLVFAGSIADELLRAPNLAGGLRIASVAVVFAVLNSYLVGGLAGLEAYPAMARASICGATIQVTACTIGGWFGGVNGAVIGLILGGVSQWFMLSFLLQDEQAKQLLEATYRGLSREWELIWKYLVPAGLSGFVSMPAVWFANVLLVRSSDGFNQIAIYSVASNIRMCILFLPHIVNGVGVSLINVQTGLRDMNGYRKTFWLNLALTTLTAILGACVAVLMGHHVLALFGKAFTDGESVLTILSVAAVVEAFAVAMYQVIQSRAEMWRSLWLVCLPRDLTFVVVTYLLVPGNGAVGLAYAFAVACGVWLSTTVALVVSLGISPSHVRSVAMHR